MLEWCNLKWHWNGAVDEWAVRLATGTGGMGVSLQGGAPIQNCGSSVILRLSGFNPSCRFVFNLKTWCNTGDLVLCDGFGNSEFSHGMRDLGIEQGIGKWSTSTQNVLQYTGDVLRIREHVRSQARSRCAGSVAALDTILRHWQW